MQTLKHHEGHHGEHHKRHRGKDHKEHEREHEHEGGGDVSDESDESDEEDGNKLKGFIGKFKKHQKKLKEYEEKHQKKDRELQGHISRIEKELQEENAKTPKNEGEIERLTRELKAARHKRAEHIRGKKTIVRVHLHDVLHAVGLHGLAKKVQHFHDKLKQHDKAQNNLANAIENGEDTEEHEKRHAETLAAVQNGVTDIARHVGDAAAKAGVSDIAQRMGAAAAQAGVHPPTPHKSEPSNKQEKTKFGKFKEGLMNTADTAANMVLIGQGLMPITIEFK